MTIHKAKGLEFDTVILPGLGRQPQNDPPSLLRWIETPQGRNEERGNDDASELLLAPVRATGAEHDRLYQYIGALDAEKGRNENGRLLYVAATRARRRLHLLGAAQRGKDDAPPRPHPQSLLALLWPIVEADFEQPAEGEPAVRAEPVEARPSGNLHRLVAGWQPPSLPPPAPWQAGTLPPLPDALPPVEFDWASETTRHVGTVVHRALQQIGREGLAPWTPGRLDALLKGFELALAHQGVPPDKLADAGKRVSEAVARALKDKRGAWLFDSGHTQAKSEYPLSFDDHGQLVTVIIDRTFVDKDGVRWIVDFKTGPHSGGGVEAFLDRELERYRGQLEKYAAVLQRLDPRPVKLGLYFPLLGGWREWGMG
jgi:ATP-dependent exoDNAse (exonuclease V) beta subunit